MAGSLAGAGGIEALTFVLQQYVNRDWARGVLSFPVKFRKGAYHPQSVSLRGPILPLNRAG